jgi:hypothetical protein
MRAVAVAAPVPEGRRGGDRRDVLATYPERGYSETVAFGVEVLRVTAGGSSFGSLDDAQPSLVLLVWPSDAERLASASALGVLTVAVVGPEEEAATG